MKKLWIAGFILGTLMVAGCGGGDKSTSSSYSTTTTTTTTRVPATSGIPSSVLDKFHEMFPAAHDVSWRLDEGVYKANFEVGSDNMNASFNPDGSVVKINS